MKALLEKLWRHKSALVLIAANLAPLAGVLFAGWDAFDMVFLYWLENVVIGFFNICKMLSFPFLAAVFPSASEARQKNCTTADLLPTNPPPGALEERTAEPNAKPPTWGQRLLLLLGMLFLAGFFAFHYGMFTFVHGVFVLAFGQLGGAAGGGAAGGPFEIVPFALAKVQGPLAIPFLILIGSHGFSFLWNYLLRREYARVHPMDLMQAPYGRVIVMHFTVLFGGFLSIFLPPVMAGLLVLLKTAVDVRFHLKEREKGAIRVFGTAPASRAA
jgi:hypothetical protein